MIQEQVINKILKTRDSSLITLNALTDEFFSNCKEEFNFIKDHINKYGNVPDLETFCSKFDDFPVINVSESDEYLITELFKDKNVVTLANTFNDVKDLVDSGKVEDAVSLVLKSAEKITSGISLKSFDLLDGRQRFDQYIERTRDFSKFYISTGLKELDAIIGGWDREDDYVTVAARPGLGKTWILLKFLTAAAEQGLNVGLYSGEMSERMVGYRFDTLVSHLSNGGMMHGNENIKFDYQTYIESLKGRFKGSVKVLTPSMINGPAGVSALRAFIEKDKLDILFVDQHSLLEDDRHARNPIERAANISKDIKTLQTLKHIPIITASQQNRAKSEDGKVGTENIAQSDRISQDSSLILFLDRKDDLLTIEFGKMRFGSYGKKLQYNVDLNKGLFTYIPDENEESTASDDNIRARYMSEEPTGGDVF